MVFSVLSGGLGNQMFQYAMGYACARRLGCGLVLDVSEMKEDSKRQFALSPFRIREKTFQAGSHFDFFIWRILHGVFGKIRILNEKKEFIYDPETGQISGNIRLKGYWQCPQYFESCRDELTGIFSLKRESPEFDKRRKEIMSRESVGIHVRRGDYVSDPLTNEVHGTCSMEYYREAIAHLKALVPESDLHFYIFSDDAEWCRENFAFLENATVAETLGDAEDLLLLSTCNHNIIANSSFSWWAAWLNNNRKKTVIAPRKWFNNANHDISGLLPEDWIKM